MRFVDAEAHVFKHRDDGREGHRSARMKQPELDDVGRGLERMVQRDAGLPLPVNLLELLDVTHCNLVRIALLILGSESLLVTASQLRSERVSVCRERAVGELVDPSARRRLHAGGQLTDVDFALDGARVETRNTK